MVLVRICLPLLFLANLCFGQHIEFTLAGEYQGRNIYVQNPLSSDKVNFCALEVYLNDRLIIEKPKSSAFEINLSEFNIGQPVILRITHREGCSPKIINPQVIRARSRFQFLSFSIDEQSISWFTTGEEDNGKFFIEQFLNNQWFSSGEILAKGSLNNNHYSVSPSHHSGENTYRIKYVNADGKIVFSKVERFFSYLDPVSFYPTRVDNKIYLSREIPFEVVDPQGNLITKGISKEITLNNLQSGLYYLKIDNRQESFFKK